MRNEKELLHKSHKESYGHDKSTDLEIRIIIHAYEYKPIIKSKSAPVEPDTSVIRPFFLKRLAKLKKKRKKRKRFLRYFAKQM